MAHPPKDSDDGLPLCGSQRGQGFEDVPYFQRTPRSGAEGPHPSQLAPKIGDMILGRPTP